VAKSWAISGLDLHVDPGSTGLRAGLEGALRDAVRGGRLAPGTRLPSSRSLARDLGVARNTVAAAYGQLVAEGWLTAQSGSGTHVASHAHPDRAHAVAEREPRQPRFDLRAGSPDVAAFPRTAWLASARRALLEASADALGYSDARGRIELRRALAAYLGRARGVRADPECIVVCSGFAQGLTALCEVLGGGIAFEAFGHQRHRDTVTAHGLPVSALAVDEHGAVTSELSRQAAAVLTPAHQFPLGPVLAAGRRTAAVEWARATGGLIVEDDYDGEFRYDRRPVGAMQALAPDHVAYAGTASKSLAPGLHLGWLVVPRPLVAEVARAVQYSGGPSALDQLTMAKLVESNGYDRQVRRARLAYRRRRDRLVAALGPETRVTGIAAGLHAVVELGEADEDEIVAAAAERGVVVDGLRSYAAPGHAKTPALVVGYGTPPEHAYSTAIARLAAALRL
jgi:GntR family transcriptional regulator / MocR family aminotransferase